MTTQEHTPESAKREWQRLHALWVAAIDRGEQEDAAELMTQCDALAPLFSTTHPKYAR